MASQSRVSVGQVREGQRLVTMRNWVGQGLNVELPSEAGAGSHCERCVFFAFFGGVVDMGRKKVCFFMYVTFTCVVGESSGGR
jgi:hypothetical protein